MNYLAHLHLGGPQPAQLLGSLYGDFVKGRLQGQWPDEIERAIQLHRRIDAFTDAHPRVAALRERFAPGRRRYAGIVLDVYFDHLLARDWNRWRGSTDATDVPLDAFSARAYRVLHDRLDVLPPRLQAIAPRMAEGDWFGSYRARAGVDRAVTRMSHRLSRDGARMVDALQDLQAVEADAERMFAPFFVDLIGFAAGERERIRCA